MIEHSTGNILESNADALVNPVNCVGIMGAGLALKFRETFRQNYYEYQYACNRDLVKIGRVFVTKHEPHPWIINFPTKVRPRDKSRIEWIESGLLSLVAEVKTRDIQSIAIPALGCGLGGLSWSDVLPLIERAACAIPDVRVIFYAPKEK